MATFTPRKKGYIRNFDSVHKLKQNNFSILEDKSIDNFSSLIESSIDSGIRSLSGQHQKDSYKDLLNMI